MPSRRTETNKKTIQKYNDVFSKTNLNIRIVEWNSETIHLNNGIVLADVEKRKFRSRFKSPFAVKFFDKIYEKTNYTQRDQIMKQLVSENAKGKSIEIWNNLSLKDKEERYIHMRKIKKLVDQKNIPYHTPWNKGKTKDTDKRLMKVSNDMKGAKNHMYGIIPSDETRAKQSNSIKSTIKAGLFTPNIHNSRTHLESIFNGQKYRSSWEAIYASLNPDDLYEKIRVEYEYKNKKRIYIVDFVNYKNKLLVEIKPEECKNTQKNKCKFKAAEKWCKDNNFTFMVFTQKYFIENYFNIQFNKLQIPNIESKLRKIKYEATKQKNNTQT